MQIVQSSHEGMRGQVIDGGEMSTAFDIIVLQSMAEFSHRCFLYLLLRDAFKDWDMGVPDRFRT